MIRPVAILAILLGASGCSQPQAAQNAATNASEPLAKPPGEGPGNAATNDAAPAAGAGKMMVAVRDAQCREVGPGASDEPWTIKKGSFVKLVQAEGAQTRVEIAGGMAQCLIASDALGPA
jgi:hypothetical protein